LDILYISGIIFGMNEPKHCLAVLRRRLEMSQKEMSSLIGCSMATIQAIEYGKLNLSEKLAQEISLQTGVSLEWLLKNDVSAQIIDTQMAAYTKERFEEFRAVEQDRTRTGPASAECFHTWNVNNLRLLALMIRAVENAKLPLLAYKLARTCDELDRQLGVNDADRKTAAAANEWSQKEMTKIVKDPVSLIGCPRPGFSTAIRRAMERKGKKLSLPTKRVDYVWQQQPDGQTKYYPLSKTKAPFKPAPASGPPSPQPRRRRASR
jgi:transcriptional regulator with XRE-family HTH domain